MKKIIFIVLALINFGLLKAQPSASAITTVYDADGNPFDIGLMYFADGYVGAAVYNDYCDDVQIDGSLVVTADVTVNYDHIVPIEFYPNGYHPYIQYPNTTPEINFIDFNCGGWRDDVKLPEVDSPPVVSVVIAAWVRKNSILKVEFYMALTLDEEGNITSKTVHRFDF